MEKIKAVIVFSPIVLTIYGQKLKLDSLFKPVHGLNLMHKVPVGR